MTDQDWADKAAESIRVWKANYSETGKLRGGPCVWLYNPKGEAVVLMFPQDRPEAEGVVSEIVNGLNASLIRSHTAPGGLVDVDKAVDLVWYKLLSDATGKQDYPETLDIPDEEQKVVVRKYNIHAAMKFLFSALSSHEPKVCEWGFRKFNSTLDPNIYINCKNEPIVAMYYDLSAKPYCPNCGGVIKVKESGK